MSRFTVVSCTVVRVQLLYVGMCSQSYLRNWSLDICVKYFLAFCITMVFVIVSMLRSPRVQYIRKMIMLSRPGCGYVNVFRTNVRNGGNYVRIELNVEEEIIW